MQRESVRCRNWRPRQSYILRHFQYSHVLAVHCLVNQFGLRTQLRHHFYIFNQFQFATEVKGPEFSRDNSPFMLENFLEVGTRKCLDDWGTKVSLFVLFGWLILFTACIPILFYHLPIFLSQLSAVTRRHFGQAEAEEPEISKAWRSSWSFSRPLV